MNEQNNESQPTPNQTQPAQTNQNKPALAGVCLVCGGGCAVGDTMCARCDGLMRGWLREYPSWLDALHEFLDSTAHYGAASLDASTFQPHRRQSDCRCSTTCRPSRMPQSHSGAGCTLRPPCLGRPMACTRRWWTCCVSAPAVLDCAACLTSPTSTMSGSRWFERRWTSSTCRLRNMASADARTRCAESN